ncbi:MAG: hypothetical protein G01um101425_593 [Candidatus Peregrinibacteria bacterium Gr01-1014_25]|nr:MAG: hypothetical protein G01um101425_593 [Candidatus Peregrinibacteria bacterium Gr01-1014_25]
MGAPNHELIPAAILLDHPGGLTAEEFVEALDATRFSWASCSVEKDWGDYGPGTRTDEWYGTQMNEASDFHRGIFGLAEILGLKRTAYRTDMERLMRETEFDQDMEYFQIVPQKEGEQWREPHYRFMLHTHDEIGERQQIACFGENIEPGRLITHYVSGQRAVVERVLSREKLRGDDAASEILHEDDNEWDRGPCGWKTTVEARSITHCYTQETFRSLASMLAAHPDVDPVKIYDFAQERGTVGGLLAKAPWLQRDGKYFLDTESIWRENHETLFTSIHITADAIRRGAWNLLGYDGMRHLQRYFADMPEARKAHERVVLQWWAARHAEKKGMTNTELLRFLQELRMHTPISDHQQAVYAARCVESEGCGWGRYLLHDVKEKRAFSEDEHAALVASIEEERGATPWLREYLRRNAPPQPATVPLSSREDAIPF